MSVAVYPGSFDPFTMGHLDILLRACRLFDMVHVGVLHNVAKTPAFSLQERQELIRAAVEANGVKNVRIAAFDGLLVDFAAKVGAGAVIRGLRTAADFEYEAQIGAANKRLAPGLETVCLIADGGHSFISSGLVREIGAFGGALDGLVPEAIKNIIAERLIKR